MTRDEREETGLRAVLNFGHTVGHAIEAVAGYGGAFQHGEAVAVGMVAESRIAERLGWIGPEVTRSAGQRCSDRLGLPTAAPGLDPDALIEAMGRDKKNRGGRIRFVLPTGDRPGRADRLSADRGRPIRARSLDGGGRIGPTTRSVDLISPDDGPRRRPADLPAPCSISSDRRRKVLGASIVVAEGGRRRRPEAGREDRDRAPGLQRRGRAGALPRAGRRADRPGRSAGIRRPSPDPRPADPPLRPRGRSSRRDALAVAIVGSRKCTPYGLRIAERLGHSLGRVGLTVVSGLARGIDAAAHRGALEAGGRTIAVLANGLAEVYPPEHEGLAREVAASGAVISELPMRQEPLAGLFPQRNRIISGLSLGVVVVEATPRSGSLSTARHAMEQNREVFAVPGPVDSLASRGCHRLIRDGARLVETVDDILEELGPLVREVRPSADATPVRHPAELALSRPGAVAPRAGSTTRRRPSTS